MFFCCGRRRCYMLLQCSGYKGRRPVHCLYALAVCYIFCLLVYLARRGGTSCCTVVLLFFFLFCRRRQPGTLLLITGDVCVCCVEEGGCHDGILYAAYIVCSLGLKYIITATGAGHIYSSIGINSMKLLCILPPSLRRLLCEV